MNSFWYCTITTCTALICAAFVCWLIYKGASIWLVGVAAVLALCHVVPGQERFTCPNCGHTEKVKVFTVKGSPIGVQNEKDDQ